MPSKYFSPSKVKKDKKVKAATSSLSKDQVLPDDISKAVQKKIDALTMKLFANAEDLLGSFNASSVDNIPDDVIENSAEFTYFGEITIPQRYNAPDSPTFNPTIASEASVIIESIIAKLGQTTNDIVNATQYYGRLNGNVFTQKIIRYDEQGNPYYDLRITGLPENSRMKTCSLKLKKIS